MLQVVRLIFCFDLFFCFGIRVPLIIEVWSKDANQRDALIGMAQIHLSNVFFVLTERAKRILCIPKILMFRLLRIFDYQLSQ